MLCMRESHILIYWNLIDIGVDIIIGDFYFILKKYRKYLIFRVINTHKVTNIIRTRSIRSKSIVCGKS